MRSILVHMDATEESRERLQTALALARRTKGHLTVHLNTPVGRFVIADPLVAMYPMTDAINAARAETTALEGQLEAALAREDVPFDIVTTETDLPDALVDAARLVDLVLVGLGSPVHDSPPLSAATVGALATAAGAPVLALPAGEMFDPAGAAMVAWNDSREAANALRAAVPLLRYAASVTLVTVPERSGDRCDPDAALRYLSRHDIHAEQAERPRDGRSVEEILEAAADALEARWIVMGAYGHSRMRELLFGGVTRYMIDCGRFPLFMAH